MKLHICQGRFKVASSVQRCHSAARAVLQGGSQQFAVFGGRRDVSKNITLLKHVYKLGEVAAGTL
jgi:hypothetical protein